MVEIRKVNWYIPRIETIESLWDRSFSGLSPLYVVGGAVRDGLIRDIRGEEPFSDKDDIDLTSSATPDEVVSMLDTNAVQWHSPDSYHGKEGEQVVLHGTVVVHLLAQKWEHTTFRKDVPKKGDPSHKLDSVIFTRDIAEDAIRRDFTVNALYYRAWENEVVDPIGGSLEDFDLKVIKVIGGPERYHEDPLRIFRLARMIMKTGFMPEENTFNWARDMVHLLKYISVERMVAEIVKGREYGSSYFEWLAKLGALQFMFPEWDGALPLCNSEAVMWASLIPLEYLSTIKERLKLSNEVVSYVTELNSWRGWQHLSDLELRKVATSRRLINLDDVAVFLSMSNESLSDLKIRVAHVTKELVFNSTHLLEWGVESGPNFGVLLNKGRDLALQGFSLDEIRSRLL